MLVTICICVLIVVLTIAVHSAGTFLCVWYQIRHKDKHIGAWTKRDRWRIFLSTALVLMALHMIEAFLWAVTYLVLPAVHQIKTLEEAMYFSMITFSTLGYGDITLDPGVRLLSGVEAMNGILLFGWSTAFLFLVVQRAWQLGREDGLPSDR